MYQFSYSKPDNIAAAKQVGVEDEDAMFLSGGMTLLPTMKQRLVSPSQLVDLTGVSELQGITLSAQHARIGACTTHAEVAASADLASFCSSITVLAGGVGDPAVRHRGTIGGSLANNDPAADYPSAVLGLNATLVTSDREIDAEDFFEGMFDTALEDGEILTAVRFPRPRRAAYRKYRNPASGYAIAGVFVAELADGEIRVAVTGAGSEGVFRWTEVEELLAGSFASAAFDVAEINEAELLSDIHASADYRADLMRAMGKRAVAQLGSGLR